MKPDALYSVVAAQREPGVSRRGAPGGMTRYHRMLSISTEKRDSIGNHDPFAWYYSWLGPIDEVPRARWYDDGSAAAGAGGSERPQDTARVIPAVVGFATAKALLVD